MCHAQIHEVMRLGRTDKFVNYLEIRQSSHF
jgi:hypothetical protein